VDNRQLDVVAVDFAELDVEDPDLSADLAVDLSEDPDVSLELVDDSAFAEPLLDSALADPLLGVFADSRLSVR
jgi:hypothetical protein